MLEKRFNEFKKSIKPIEFNSVEFLQNKAESLKASDPELSARILIRVQNLQKNKQIATANISNDVRNGIHGLEMWPFD